MRIIFIGHTDVTKLDMREETESVPAIRDELDCVEFALSDMSRALWDLVWYEECQSERIIVLHAARTLSRQPDIFLLELEVLGVKHLRVVIHNDPEGL